MASDPFHDRLLSIVNELPEAYEDRPWGSVHCKVAGKIFVGWGRDEQGGMSIGFKTNKLKQSMLVGSDPRFKIAAYVGKHGWVDMRLGARPNWGEVEHFIIESYRMIAPKKLVKQLDGGAPAAKPAAKAKRSVSAKQRAPKRKAAKRPSRSKSARA